MSGKTLRLALAMGGGVSLGSFSGGALSEVLKLLILAKNAENEYRWDSVKLDVLSGSSAGALSLLVMIRTLASPKKLILTTAEPENYDWRSAKKSLETWLSERGYNDQIDCTRKKMLIEAQLVQEAEHFAWVDEVDFQRLSSEFEERKYNAGLLNQEAVTSIAQKVMGFAKGGSEEPIGIEESDRAALLADRVLFACSLTNLQPVLDDSRDGAPPLSRAGLRDGMRNLSHRESRVFDLRFGSNQKWEQSSYWVRYQLDKTKPGKAGNLNSNGAWAKMAATAIACGAFPFAFEPVILPRRQYEYPTERWDKMKMMYPIEAQKDTTPGTIHFAYVDGGVFNNEPIREAFRLASFLDSQDPDPMAERRVIFVDPAVSEEDPKTPLPYLRSYSHTSLLHETFGEATRSTKMASRLGHVAVQLITALRNEASGVESSKISETESRLKERDKFANLIFGLLGTTGQSDDTISGPLANKLRELATIVRTRIENKAKNDLFPDSGLTLQTELQRVLRLSESASINCNERAAAIVQFVDSKAPLHQSMVRPLIDVIIDNMLNLSSKSATAELIAIGPFTDSQQSKEGPQRIRLLGAGLSGFDGFFSKDAREHDFQAGQLCAATALRASSIIPTTFIMPTLSNIWQQVEPKLLEGRHELVRQALTATTDAIPMWLSHIMLAVLRFFPNTIAQEVAGSISTQHTRKPIKVFFLIRVNDPKLELAEPAWLGKDDCAIPSVDGRGHILLACCQFDLVANNITWSGRNVKDNKIHIWSDGVFWDEPWCTIELPEKSAVSAFLEFPNRIFLANFIGESIKKGTAYKCNVWAVEHMMPVPLEQRLLKKDPTSA